MQGIHTNNIVLLFTALADRVMTRAIFFFILFYGVHTLEGSKKIYVRILFNSEYIFLEYQISCPATITPSFEMLH